MTVSQAGDGSEPDRRAPAPGEGAPTAHLVIDEEGTLPLGAPFRPGLDPLPPRQHAWAVVKDRLGRPAHGEPRAALHRVTIPVPEPGPTEAIGYVLYAGLT
jgi:hypothetical protein